jgi:hypothetical protein
LDKKLDTDFRKFDEILNSQKVILIVGRV